MTIFRIGRAVLLIMSVLPASLVQAQAFSDAGASPTGYNSGDIEAVMTCQAVAQLSLREVTAITTKMVPAGNGVPAFCQVDGTIHPEITFQVNLPIGWNGRFYMTGNGGHAGQQPNDPFSIAGRNQALANYFVTAMTDTGHNAAQEPGASFVMSNPQKAIDYAYRAVHVTAQTAKQIAAQYYGEPVAYSYWNSCSNGGRQGLLEAQRYPQDFDGIIVNAPWVDQTGFTIGAIWNQRALDEAPLTAGKVELLARHVMQRCDAVDGLEDGLIDDPRNCDLDIARDVPACPAGTDNDSCLTTAQAQAVQKIYDGPRTSEGEQIFPGFMPGSEALVTGPGGAAVSSWMGMIVPASADAVAADFNLAQDTMRYLVPLVPDPDWDYRTFDFDNDTELLDRWSRLADATDVNLRDFRAGGGKLLMTYGWSDQILQPMMGVSYYEQALTANGPDGEDFIRLFMLPGMTHCSGGLGPDQLDPVTAVIDWVELGKAPEVLVARKMVNGAVSRSRPVCPYPQVAKYRGQGSMDQARNFSCEAP